MSQAKYLQEFEKLGCKDRTKCALACRVYQDLQTDKRLKNLERCYTDDLDLLYIRGLRDNVTVNFLPVLSSKTLNLQKLSEAQTKFSRTATSGYNFVLAICDSSSNVLYYQMTPDFVDKK